MSYAFTATALARRYMELDVTPQFDGYSGVEIIVDENTSYFAGSENGRVLRINNPWGTMQNAQDILTQIQGFQYQPYEATGAFLDPSMELGDGVSMSGTYSGLYKIDREYSSIMATDIAAPQDEEIDHEYPFESKTDREIVRRFTAVQSELSLASNEIAAKVSKTSPEGQTSFSWSLLDSSWEVKSNGNTVFKVTSAGAEVTGKITATSGKIGNFNIGSTAIWNNIPDFSNSGNLSSGVYLGTNGIRLGKNFTVDTSGNVTANNMKLTGTLTVGDSTITANNLRLGASRANGGYSSWNGTTSAWNTATSNGSQRGPAYFYATSLVAVNMTSRDGTFTNLTFKGYLCRWSSITINGVTYNVMTHP